WPRKHGGRLYQLAVVERPASRRVDHAMILALALCRIHAPLAGRRVLEHRARHGPELPHAVVVVTDAARAVGVLIAVLLVADRLFDLDSAPVRLQLVGEDHRNAGAHALAHLRAMGDDGHGTGRIDGHEEIRVQRGTDGGRGRRDRREWIDASKRIKLERECARSRRGDALEEGPAADVLNGVHDFTPAASLMAARIRLYVPHRQMLPPITASICASVGFGFFASSEAACMICPAWQYPHWGTLLAIQAFCRGWS